MIHLATIIGARPQFIKASIVSKTFRNQFADSVKETIIHSGQHYDESMSAIFFRELEIQDPSYNLEIGSGTSVSQTGNILLAAEKVLEEIKPDVCLVYGDTNTTLAGALAASKLQIPLIHVEAGLRSFNKSEPEEINRVLTDHLSSILCCPTETAIKNLEREGFHLNTIRKANNNHPVTFLSGDVMYDLFLEKSKGNLPSVSTILNTNQTDTPFILVTIHRAGNTDQANVLNTLLKAMMMIADKSRMKIILPLHPRTKKAMFAVADQEIIMKFTNHTGIQIIEPVSYLEILSLLNNCKLVMTDAGGLQKEAYFSGKACVILRNETEWKELTEHHYAFIGGTEPDSIDAAFNLAMNAKMDSGLNLFGNGDASKKIGDMIVKQFT